MSLWRSGCALALVVGVISVLGTLGKPAESKRLQFRGAYDEYEDGKKLADSFEFWELSCAIPLSGASCQLQVASFTRLDHETHLFQWLHRSNRIRNVGPNLYRVSMNGRLSPCSGLELVVTTNPEQSKILNVHGSMQSGTQCQSLAEFKPDFRNPQRKLSLRNPFYRYLDTK